MHSCLSIAPAGTDVGLRLELAALGLRLHEVPSARAGLLLLSQFGFESILLDTETLGWASLDVLEALMQRTRAPVLVLGRADADRVRRASLESGAADWLVKPASPQLIGRRLRTLVRTLRSDVAAGGQAQPSPRLTLAGGLHIDRLACQATLHGQRLGLSASQVEMLHLLAARVGQVVSRAELRAVVSARASTDSRGIDTRISRLRKAMAAVPDSGWQVDSVHHRGYRLEPAARRRDEGRV